MFGLLWGLQSGMKILFLSLAVIAIAIYVLQIPGLGILKQMLGYTSLTGTTRENLQSGLHSVKVSEHDATEFQRNLQLELLDYWKEGFKVNEQKNIPTKNIPRFLDHVRSSYEGVDDEMRQKMNSIQYAKTWGEKSFEFNCDEKRHCKAIYVVMAFGKAQDMKSIDFIHAHYKMEFKVAPKVIITVKDNSMLWGLYNWQSIESRVEEHTLGLKTINQLRNFVRYKALVGFYNEGYIDTINNMESIEDNSEES